MIILRTILFLVVLLFGAISIFPSQNDSASVPRMTIAELNSKLDDPSFIIIDVRSNEDWNESTKKIKRAVREEPQQVGSWISKYSRDKNIVLY